MKFPDRKTFDAAVAEARLYREGSVIPSTTPYKIFRGDAVYAGFSDKNQRDQALISFMVDAALRVVLEAQ